MAIVQGELGKITLIEDCVGGEDIVANTAASRLFGQAGFRVVGEGIAETDSGIVLLEADGLNGVAQLTTTDEADHSCGLVTAKMFEPARMGTLIAECRVRFTDLDTKEFYFGFTDENEDNENLEGSTIHGETTTITLTASDLCGFLLSSELTDDEDWHMVHNGGTTTGVTDSTLLDADEDAVAGDFQILRIEIDPNGTARWFINGKLKKTLAGAVAPTTDFAVLAMVEAKGAAIETVDIDYILVRANRDWTV